jgi:predicted TIM-barrel fold metal-dependent hydrolase
MGMDRCVWGTNGLPWKTSIEQMDQIGLKDDVKRKVLRDNTAQLFGI